MSLKKHVQNLAEGFAQEVTEREFIKLLRSFQVQGEANYGKVKEIVGPNEFKVEVAGKTKNIKYLGNTPKGPGAIVFLNGNSGDYGLA